MKSQLCGVDPLPLLQEAERLLDLQFVVAAAVTARAALEAHILTLCSNVEYTPISKRGGQTSGMIQALAKLRIFDQETVQRCHRILRAGGNAAHGRGVEPWIVLEAISDLNHVLKGALSC